MNKIITILLILFSLLGLGILIPLFKQNNFNKLNPEEQKFADYSLIVANDLFENPIEKLLILRLRVRQVEKNKILIINAKFMGETVKALN